MSSQPQLKQSWFAPLGWLAFIVATLYVTNKWNPLDYVVEAAPPAYYQARIAYERGSPSQRDAIAVAFEDGKISWHDYSAQVFPAFLKVVRYGENLFPETEHYKSLEDHRRVLAQAVESRAL